MSVDNQNKLNTDGVGLSTTVGTESTVTDPNLQAVLAGRGAAHVHAALPRPGDLPATLGAAFNDATVALFLGKSDPREGLPGDHRRGCHAVGRSPRVDHS